MIKNYAVTILHGKNEKASIRVGAKPEPKHADTRRKIVGYILKSDHEFTCSMCHVDGKVPGNRPVHGYTDDLARETLIVTLVCDNPRCIALNEDLYRRTQHDPTNIRCVMCGVETTQKCQNCPHVFYCGESCQKKDWEKHKLVCGQKIVLPNQEKTPSDGK